MYTDDANKDGLLSQEECTQLVRDSLEATKHAMPSRVSDAIINILVMGASQPLGTV